MEGLITSVEVQKRNKHRYNIYVNEQYAFSVHEDVLLKHRLFKDEQINAERMSEIIQDEERHQALQQALRFLSKKQRSSAQLQDKLRQKGYDAEIIVSVIKQLQDHGYVNDLQLAQSLAQYTIQTAKKGRRWLKQDLQQKGIHRDQIDQVIDQVSDEDELQGATELASKRWNRMEGSERDKQRKLIAFLLRRGYSVSVAKKALQTVADGEVSSELEEWE